MTRAPIRVRLTGWYVLVLAVVLVALGTFVVTRLRADLTAEVDRGLEAAAGRIAAGYAREGVPELRDVARTVLPGQAEGSGVQLVGGDGRLLLRVGDEALQTPLLTPEAGRHMRDGATEIASEPTPGADESLRVVAVGVRRGTRRLTLVVAESLEDVDDAVHRVVILLLVGGTVALALLALGGWWIARRALLPVERMTDRADRIGIADLSERIAVPRAQDEIGHLARTLNRMLARLEAGVQARERLVADASHELRAPLTAMRAELEVSLRHDELDPGARGVLASTRDEVVRMSRMVDNLLTLARVDEGPLELLTAPEDLRALAEQTARAHRAAAEAAGVTLEVRGDPVVLPMDGDRLAQVLGNLVDNAIRFSPPGGEVGLEVWRDGSEAGVTVTDEGPGVPEELRARLFERFARGDPARGRDAGAGLGLAISRELVAAHGGRVLLAERPGGGSAFGVALPM